MGYPLFIYPRVSPCRARYFLRSPSMGFALRAILQLSQFAPCEWVLLAQEKVPKEKYARSPHRPKLQGRFAALPMRSSHVRGRAQLARSLTLTALRQGARLYPGRAAVLGEGYGDGE
jgi:hypothetical protein